MKLLEPLKYLSIRHDEKRWYDLWYPLCGSILVTAIYFFMETPFSIFGKSGLVTQINGLLQVLIGFYIASLAAIATFSNPTIDEVMAGTPPKVKELYRGKILDVELVRRRFLCYLFGYLALVSFILFGFGLVASLFTSQLMTLINSFGISWVLKAVKVVFIFGYTLVLFNMLSTTLLGLYYLAVRIHQPND
ncbi:hypothetical protein I4990_00955 [Providencia alcalifaciens]|uniref:hypothetical protein n=1 Tax=Providencia alcalifaciens TaxID=126385 RepID=UPI0018C85E4A|nr:hypothetical protein [Providencia alcalifaciens]MBG5881523.1 hypothetical protein [Providencia alcalifaciens]